MALISCPECKKNLCNELGCVTVRNCPNCGYQLPQEKLAETTTPPPPSNGNEVTCPRCHSTSITAQKKGYSVSAGVVGELFVGLPGLLLGAAGRNDIVVTCLNCGHKWKPSAASANAKPDVRTGYLRACK